MNDVHETLFVYGTLMRGERGHHFLADCPYLGEDTTVPGFGLVHVDWYPGLVRADVGTVQGELYAVKRGLWTALDRYEDCPNEYERIVVELDSGRQAQTYLFRHAAGHPSIVGGNWRLRST